MTSAPSGPLNSEKSGLPLSDTSPLYDAGTISPVRLVIQRVSEASVTVEDVIVGSIGPGFVVLCGVEPNDGASEVGTAVDKLTGLRVFPDELGKMNLDIGQVGGEILLVSQFTLLADVRKGRRPSFTSAAAPDHAVDVIGALIGRLRETGIPTAEGVFGAHMRVALVNDGPVTVTVDIREGRLV